MLISIKKPKNNKSSDFLGIYVINCKLNKRNLKHEVVLNAY